MIWKILLLISVLLMIFFICLDSSTVDKILFIDINVFGKLIVMCFNRRFITHYQIMEQQIYNS